MQKKKNTFFYRNGLSIVVLTCMLISLTGQFFTGWHEKNDELKKEHMPALTVIEYSKVVILSRQLLKIGKANSFKCAYMSY